MTRHRPVHSTIPHLPDVTVPGGGPVNGRLVVVPHVSPSDYRADPIRWTPAVSRTNVGKVRVGFGDGVVNLGHRYVPIAPAFDPLADSMVPARDRKGIAA